MECHECGRTIDGEPAAGMNLPGVTDGPVYWCGECAPQGTAKETARIIASFIDPPKESGHA